MQPADWVSTWVRGGQREQRASWPPPRRSAGAASRCSAPGSSASCSPRPSWPARRSATGRATRPGRDRLVRPRPARPGHPDRPAGRLQRRRGTASSGSRRPRAPMLASGVAEQADRRVYLRRPPSSARSQRPGRPGGPRAARPSPTSPSILIGANDVTHTVLPSVSVRHLPRRVRRLREAGVEVVVGTCPDLGTIRPIAPPLQAGGPGLVATAGGRPDHRRGRERRPHGLARRRSWARSSTPRPAVMFGPDRFHPSAEGYQPLASVLLPSVLAALGLLPEDEAQPEPLRGEGVLPVAAAAVRAVAHARHRARRHRGRRQPARRCAAAGSSCATAAAARPRDAESPGEPEDGAVRPDARGSAPRELPPARPSEDSGRAGRPSTVGCGGRQRSVATAGSRGSAAGWCRSRPG